MNGFKSSAATVEVTHHTSAALSEITLVVSLSVSGCLSVPV